LELVIIATDDVSVYIPFSAEVEALGYEAFWASNGLEAVMETERRHPLVVFLDERLPVLNPYEACENLRMIPEFHRDLPIYLITHNEVDPRAREMAGFTGEFPASHGAWALQDLMAHISTRR